MLHRQLSLFGESAMVRRNDDPANPGKSNIRRPPCDGGDGLRIPMPQNLMDKAITAFLSNADDQRVLELTCRMRRLCRKVLGIAADYGTDKVFGDALYRLKYPAKGQVHECIGIRNQIVHEDHHATKAEVAMVEAAWVAFKEHVCRHFGIPADQAVTQYKKAAQSAPKSEKLAPAKTLWSGILGASDKASENWKSALEDLLELYELPLLCVFTSLAGGDKSTGKANWTAFCAHLRSGIAFANARHCSSFRRFLADAIVQFESIGPQPPRVVSDVTVDCGDERLSRVEMWLTHARAGYLYQETVDETLSIGRNKQYSPQVLQILHDMSLGRASLGVLKQAGPDGKQAFEVFRLSLQRKVQDEVAAVKPQDIRITVNQEITAFFNAFEAKKE
jgi:hypothetical protein